MPKSPESSSLKKSVHLTVLQKLVIPFWTKSRDRGRVALLTLTLFGLMGAMVYALLLLNRWNQGFYDALQKLDQAQFLNQLWRFFFIALGYALVVAYKFYVMQCLAVRWRQWLTEKNLQRWLSNKNFYFWQTLPNPTDNPDQRLSDDIHELTDLSLEIAEKVLREVITFVSFIGILWGLSGSLHFNAGGFHFEIFRYLVWACLLYAVAGTWIAHKIGFPLSKLNFMQQKFEADFRYMLVRLRENSESVALAKGENYEKQKLSSKFSQVVANFRDLVRKQKTLLLTTNVYGQFAYIFPFVVASPKVFTKEITLGQLFQISSAFGQVQGSVSVFVDMYAKIMRLNSVVQRLGGFLQSLQNMNESKPLITDSGAQGPQAFDVSLLTPQGATLLSGLNLKTKFGERILLTAPSGKGKSTFVRALNGLWPYSKGTVSAPLNKKTLVLSQRPYLPLGLLKDVLTYPESSQGFSNAELIAALQMTELSHLVELLETEEPWSLRLSSGEQQRICFARIFLLKPEILFLDEATSAIEDSLEHQLYRSLITLLPNLTLLTFSHDPHGLAKFHHRQIELS